MIKWQGVGQNIAGNRAQAALGAVSVSGVLVQFFGNSDAEPLAQLFIGCQLNDQPSRHPFAARRLDAQKIRPLFQAV